MADDIHIRGREQVTGIGILCNQAQGFLLARPADQDRRMRLCQRLRAVQRLCKLVVPALRGWASVF